MSRTNPIHIERVGELPPPAWIVQWIDAGTGLWRTNAYVREEDARKLARDAIEDGSPKVAVRYCPWTQEGE